MVQLFPPFDNQENNPESNAIGVCHSQKSNTTETASLLPPSPPSFVLIPEKQTSKEEANDSKECQTVVEQQIGGDSTSSSANRVSNPNSTGFSTCSGISLADSACLEEDVEADKMERKKNSLENEGAVQHLKRNRQGKAPVLNARRKCLKKLEKKEEKVKRGKQRNALVLEDVVETDESKAKRQKTTRKLKPPTKESAIPKSATKNEGTFTDRIIQLEDAKCADLEAQMLHSSLESAGRSLLADGTQPSLAMELSGAGVDQQKDEMAAKCDDVQMFPYKRK